MSNLVGWSTMHEAFRGAKAPLKINNISRRQTDARNKIEEQSKYFNLQWKKDALHVLKAEAIAEYREAIEEANSISQQYEDKIKGIMAQQYTGSRVSKDDIATIEYELKSLKAELNMSADKNSVIERYMATRTGAKAVLLMFGEKGTDFDIWTQDIYTKAFSKSKTQAEIDFEVSKDKQVTELKAQQAQELNIGKLLAAQRILTGNPSAKLPSLERQFDMDIEACDQAIQSERETLKAEAYRDTAYDSGRFNK